MAPNNKIVKILVAIPNMGYAPVEAYSNRLVNFMHLGNIQTERQQMYNMAQYMERDNLEAYIKKHMKYTKTPDDDIFEFYFISIGRMFTPAAREEAAKKALEHKMDYIFFIDDDMICPDNMFLDLYRHNHVADIVAALAFTRNPPYHPVLYASVEGYDAVDKTEYFINNIVMNYPRNKLVEVDAVGFGACLLKTWPLTRIRPPFFMSSEGTGEDILYCAPEGIMYGDFNDISVPSEEAITHTGIRHKIDQHHQREYSGELVRIKPAYTEEIKLTPNHPVLSGIIRKNKRNQEWINAGDLKETDYLFYPKPKLNDYSHIIDLTQYAYGATITDDGIKFTRTHKESVNLPCHIKVDEDLAWLFGFYVAEGNSTKNNVVFSYNNKKEQHYKQRIIRIMKEKFRCGAYCENNYKGSGQVTFVSAVLSRFFNDNFGKGAKNKKFPKWISDNKKFSGQALRGVFDGDGMIDIQTLTTISRVLVHQVKNLLAANDIFSTIRIGSNEKRGYNRNYSIRVLAKDRKKFGELIGYGLPDAKNKSRNMYVPRIKLNDIEGWRIPIEKIDRVPYNGMVFNAGVNAVNSYVLNGVSVHNCYKAKKVGGRIFMDTSVKLGHVSHPQIVTEESVDEWRKTNDPEAVKRYPAFEKYQSLCLLGD